MKLLTPRGPQPFYFHGKPIGTVEHDRTMPRHQAWIAAPATGEAATCHGQRFNARRHLIMLHCRRLALADRVQRAWRIATEENGYTFEGWTDQAVATDMADCDSDIEALRERFTDMNDDAWLALVAGQVAVQRKTQSRS